MVGSFSLQVHGLRNTDLADLAEGSLSWQQLSYRMKREERERRLRTNVQYANKGPTQTIMFVAVSITIVSEGAIFAFIAIKFLSID